MFIKIVALFACIVVASAQHQAAARYPAGVDPSSCPGFPICDNAALHNQQPHHNQWNNHNNHNQWNNHNDNGQWNPNDNGQWNAHDNGQWNGHDDGQWNGGHNSWDNQGQWNHNQQWNHAAPAPQWNQWNQAPAVHPVSNHLAKSGGDKYPAGVNPQSCPNYPYCDNHVGSHAPQVAPLPGWNERLYPAGVSPQSCPNFPYCH